MLKKIQNSKNRQGIEAIIGFVIGVLGINVSILLGMDQPIGVVDDGPGAAFMASLMVVGLSIYQFKQWVEK